ncbi:hypothetical protein GDO81_005070 [Engystomops pustulosus]|uniref:Uncharacterized protein n=1 Tax=Engystomops pustulosus TaxID=76066 RepID=A0AAV7CLW7_ENGPU|nr:hypothetical protein GDO81_005070 [Engystomops pustulosus]
MSLGQFALWICLPSSLHKEPKKLYRIRRTTVVRFFQGSLYRYQLDQWMKEKETGSKPFYCLFGAPDSAFISIFYGDSTS